MDYSSFFRSSGASGPTLGIKNIYNPTSTQGSWTKVLVPVSSGRFSGGSSSGSSGINAIMAGLDKESAALTTQLKGIYEKYSGLADDYEQNMRPIMDDISAEVDTMMSKVSDYDQLTAGMEGDFMNGIDVESSAARRRAEYMGATGKQYDALKATIEQNLASQGINPYGNQGATRKLGLQRAADMAGASNKAYSDWHSQYNQDVQRDLAAKGAYAGIRSQVPGMYASGLNARGALANMEGGIFNAKMAAHKNTADGILKLAGIVDDRRKEALALEGARVANASTNAADQNKTVALGADPVAANNPYNPFNR